MIKKTKKKKSIKDAYKKYQDFLKAWTKYKYKYSTLPKPKLIDYNLPKIKPYNWDDEDWNSKDKDIVEDKSYYTETKKTHPDKDKGETLIFTPKHWKTKMRIEIQITQTDYDRHKKESNYKWTEITDITHNTQILVKKANCGLDCFCDAVYRIKD